MTTPSTDNIKDIARTFSDPILFYSFLFLGFYLHILFFLGYLGFAVYTGKPVLPRRKPQEQLSAGFTPRRLDRA